MPAPVSLRSVVGNKGSGQFLFYDSPLKQFYLNDKASHPRHTHIIDPQTEDVGAIPNKDILESYVSQGLRPPLQAFPAGARNTLVVPGIWDDQINPWEYLAKFLSGIVSSGSIQQR